MKKALQITTLGSMIAIDLEFNSLEKLQSAVGGWVQAIDLSDTMSMWCNEEGKMISLPHNPFGQALWEQSYGRTDYIVGDVVITGGVDDEGETISLTDEQITQVTKVVAEVNEFISPRIVVM
jgi:hypothetical protein